MKYKYSVRIPISGSLYVEFESEDDDLSDSDAFDTALEALGEEDPFKGDIISKGVFATLEEIQYHRKLVEGNYFHGALGEMEVEVDPVKDDSEREPKEKHP